VAVSLIYVFVVLVDPFGILPLSLVLDRVPVATNARYAFPSLARSHEFDSAIIGTSTSRLLRPVVLNAELGGRFVNLAMNAATPYEQSRLLAVFVRAHPRARFVLIGLDVQTCEPHETTDRFTTREFPAWMYGDNLWRGYAEMFNLYAVQEAGQLFGILIGIKREVYGHDGYTNFVPPDSQYDPQRVAMHFREAERIIAGWSDPVGDPATWRYPQIEQLRAELTGLPETTRKILYFVPYHHLWRAPAGSPRAALWKECIRRVAMLASQFANVVVVDFMISGPITDVEDNYWDSQHYRTGIADRVARDLAAANRGEETPDYRLLGLDASCVEAFGKVC